MSVSSAGCTTSPPSAVGTSTMAVPLTSSSAARVRHSCSSPVPAARIAGVDDSQHSGAALRFALDTATLHHADVLAVLVLRASVRNTPGLKSPSSTSAGSAGTMKHCTTSAGSSPSGPGSTRGSGSAQKCGAAIRSESWPKPAVRWPPGSGTTLPAPSPWSTEPAGRSTDYAEIRIRRHPIATPHLVRPMLIRPGRQPTTCIRNTTRGCTGVVHRQTRRSGKFPFRTILPGQVDPENIECTFGARGRGVPARQRSRSSSRRGEHPTSEPGGPPAWLRGASSDHFSFERGGRPHSGSDAVARWRRRAEAQWNAPPAGKRQTRAEPGCR
ncbi:hypothetical protein A8924_2794 [Saccharopolyspora erythraea NRRL 2338]|nr:hypothetical protein A8924_2794 [Saccharopolyspora erythraea NRRL 2338]